MIFEPKDPYENPVIDFDFSGELTSITGIPLIIITPINGADPNVAAMLEGAPQISGTSVLQRVGSGIPDIDYMLCCRATDGTNKRVRARILPVRAAC